MTVGWGVIGAGGIANRTIPDGILMADNASFVGITDIHAERAKSAADEFGGRVYETADEMLADPDIQAVYLATPPSVHAQSAMRAARAGKHVLSEKPMAVSVEQAEDMVRVCRENGVILGHATMMRFNAYHARMKELIAAGDIGRPLGVHARYSVWWDPDVPQDTGDDEEMFNLTTSRQIAWRQIKRIGGGGPMLDDGVHALDTMVFLLGHVREVSSFTDTLTRDRDVEDLASVMVKFDSGAQGILECYSAVPNFQGRRVLRVYGTEGQLLALETLGPPSDKNQLFRLKSDEGPGVEAQAEEVDVTPALMYETQFRLFSDAVEGGDPFPIPGDEGLHIQRIIDGVFRSSETRQVIAIED